MTRFAILTAGGDTPALNATIYGAVERANARKIEMVGLIRGYAGILDPRMPYVRLNPLFSTIPELTPNIGGTLLGASRTYIDKNHQEVMTEIRQRLNALKIDGMICIGGDGTINGMQPFCEFFPCVLAPKTIDNDLGLNYVDEVNELTLEESNNGGQRRPGATPVRPVIELDELVNFVTPGFATAVFVVVQGVERIRTTAESHRRIAIIEVMGRHSGFIPLGSSYGQPDIILIPEVPIDMDRLEHRIAELYELQKHVVIVIGEGVVDQNGHQLGAATKSFDPAGNVIFRRLFRIPPQTRIGRFGHLYT